MTEQTGHAPFSGHTGHSTYDDKRRHWAIQHFRGENGSSYQIGGDETHARPSGGQNVVKAKLARAREQDALKLSSELPEFGAAQRLICEASKSVACLPALVEGEQYSEGDLFSFGTVFDASRGKLVPVTAIAHGEPNDEVLVLRGHTLEQGWPEDATACLRSMRMEERDGVGVRLERGHILQLCFAESDMGGQSLLASRYQNSIALFQVDIKLDKALPSRKGHNSRSFGTDLQMEHFLDIISPKPDHPSFADVNFNPWNQFQLACIDGSGHWSIQNLSVDQRSKATVVFEGTHRAEKKSQDDSSRVSDGWHRIFWVGNLSIFVTCSRTYIQLYQILQHSFRKTNSYIDLVDCNKTQIILDARKAPASTDYILVATHSHIHCLKITLPEIGSPDQAALSLTKLVTIRHCRWGDDLSLRIAFSNDERDIAIHLILFSQRNVLVSEYRFRLVNDDLGHAVGTNMPRRLVLPSADRFPDHPKDSGFRSIFICPISVSIREPGSALHRICRQYGIKFGQVFVMTRDLGLRSHISYLSRENPRHEARIPFLVWKRPLVSEAPRPHERQSNFFVEDGELGTVLNHDTCLGESWQELIDQSWWSPVHISKRDYNIVHSREAADCVSPNLVYEQVAMTDSAVRTRMTEVVSLLQGTLQSSADNLDPPGRILISLLDSIPQLDDVEAAVAAIQPVLQKGAIKFPDRAMALSISSMELPDDVDLGGLEQSDLSLSSSYQFLIENWIGSMAPGVHGTIRLAKEEIARKVATSLFLSSVTVRQQPTVKTRPSQQLPSSVPLRTHDTQLAEPRTASQPAPSKQAWSSEASISKISRIMSHWKQGADPEMSGTGANSAEATEGELEPALRVKQHRRAGRQMLREDMRCRKRQRSEESEAASQPSTIARAWDSSQPRPQIPTQGQSQMQGSGQIRQSSGSAMSTAVASQLVPGAFGGRQSLVERREKTKRKAGF